MKFPTWWYFQATGSWLACVRALRQCLLRSYFSSVALAPLSENRSVVTSAATSLANALACATASEPRAAAAGSG